MKYQLRHAAGLYWLLNMDQTSSNYRAPLPLNEVGAKIWECRSRNLSDEEISEVIAGEYNIDKLTVLKDIEEFNRQLSEELL